LNNEGNFNLLKTQNSDKLGNVNNFKQAVLKTLTFTIISAKLNEIGCWYFLPDDCACDLAILASCVARSLTARTASGAAHHSQAQYY